MTEERVDQLFIDLGFEMNDNLLPRGEKGFSPSAGVCTTAAPVLIQADPTLPGFTWITALGSGKLEIEYSSLLPSGKPNTHRYIHLQANESRRIQDVGLAECVTDYSGQWSKGPSAIGKFTLFWNAKRQCWFIRNNTPHFIAVRVDVNGGVPDARASSTKAGAVGSTSGPLVGTTFMTVAPKDEEAVPAFNQKDKVTVPIAFEDVFPFSKP